MPLELYDYQEAAKQVLRQGFREVDSQLLYMPTGAGKTELSMSIFQDVAQKENRAMFISDRVALVNQTSQRFAGAGIHHGVIQGENTYGRNRDILVASVQSIMQAHRGIPASIKFIVVDECHSQNKKLNAFLKNTFKGKLLGLSATPLTPGLGDVYKRIVNAVTTNDLLERGYLCPVRAYGATKVKQLDLSKLEVNSMGEWTEDSIEKEATMIKGDIVLDWVRLTKESFNMPVQTLFFGPTVAFCEEQCLEFQKAGFDFRTSSFKDTPEETEAKIQAFRNQEFIGLASVDKFVKGFDVPQVLCIIDARPYRKAFHAFVQKLGRVMRVFPGKEFGLYICHTGNYAGFLDNTFDLFENGVDKLLKAKEKKKIQRKEYTAEEIECSECGTIFLPKQELCAGCGAARPKRQSNIRVVPAMMEELEAIKPGSRNWAINQGWVWDQICLIALEWKNGDKVAAKKLSKAHYKAKYDEWPPYEWEFFVGEPHQEGDRRVRRMMQQQAQKWRNFRKESEAVSKKPIRKHLAVEGLS